MKKVYALLAILGIAIGATFAVLAPSPVAAANEHVRPVHLANCQQHCTETFRGCMATRPETVREDCLSNFRSCMLSCTIREVVIPRP